MLSIEHGYMQILKCTSVSSKRRRRQGEALQASAQGRGKAPKALAQGNALWSSAAGTKTSPVRAKAYTRLPPFQGLDVLLLYLHRALPCANAFGALPLRCTSWERYCRFLILLGLKDPVGFSVFKTYRVWKTQQVCTPTN